MPFLTHVYQAFVNLSSAKLRSILAILGILVGTASVVALISCGRLATEKALEHFKSLGTDLLAVSVYQKESSNSKGEGEVALNVWRNIPQSLPSVRHIAPYTTLYPQVSYEGKRVQGSVIGADESLRSMININLLAGHFVSFLETFEHHCVIGQGIASRLAPGAEKSLLNQHLQLNKAVYTIVGIADTWRENGFFNEDINQAVIIPIGGISLINKDQTVNQAILLLDESHPIDKTTEGIRQLIESQAPKAGIFFRSAKQLIEGMESQGKIFTLLLAVIGSISLLVGGIGIMNVMLVSVSERKKEIGIRKAVGAKNYEIQLLFLIESIILSLFGGILGVILGLLFTAIIAFFNEWTLVFYVFPPLIGFIISILTGVFFGFYPARRAAKLTPLVSLRSDT